MTGELNLNGNKITVLRDPTSPDDAANKQYVDTGDTAVDNKLTALQSDYTAHVKSFQTANKALNDFFGERRARDINITLSEIKTKLNDIDTINTRLGVIKDSKSVSDLIVGLQTNINGIVRILNNISEGIPNIVTKTSLIKIPSGVAAADIVNIGHTVSAGSATWSQQTNTIEHITDVTGIYRLSVFSAEKFKIFTTYPWRHDTDNLSGVVSMVLNSGTEEVFILEAVNKTLIATTYWWCLEFAAETPQLVTA